MRRHISPTALTSFTLAAILSLAGCSSSDRNDGGNGNGNGNGHEDGGTNGSGDGSTGADVNSPPDSGPPPCVRDQDCPSGKVCNLRMSPAMCVDGVSCANDRECEDCAKLPINQSRDCGHGFHVLAYCDMTHGNVCVRSLGPCEPCDEDRDCGTLHPNIGGAPNKCLDYGSGKKYCGRDGALRCPSGFIRDAMDGQCRREEGCEERPAICPAPTGMQNCSGTDQICAGEQCPMGGRCATNDLPGLIGICIGTCQTNQDCAATPDKPVCNQRNGICIAGCTQNSCAAGQVCHADGFCRAPCTGNADCEMRFGANFYCNQRGQQPPNIFKNYRDTDSCAPKGCEKGEDCPAAGFVCDATQAPPACVEGCYSRDDCLSGEVCKRPNPGPRPGTYSRQECRALAEKTVDTEIGVCCNPGCTNRVLQCNINEWCCGEPGSPFESGMNCGTITSTGGPVAQPGECFDITPPPFCKKCDPMMASMDQCNSMWQFGRNTDPAVNGGQPFQEQEWCFPIAQDVAMCTVSCNPNAPDNGCPRGWICRPFFPPCLQDADCGTPGLTCEGEDTSDPMMPRPGKCMCGMNGQVATQCPTAYTQLGESVTNPRCVSSGTMGQMFCLASYHCEAPILQVNMTTMKANYPDACLQ